MSNQDSAGEMPIYPTYKSGNAGKAGNTTFTPEGGLSLRDHIAIEAMKANITVNHSRHHLNLDLLSADSYNIADAMLERRKVRNEA